VTQSLVIEQGQIQNLRRADSLKEATEPLALKETHVGTKINATPL